MALGIPPKKAPHMRCASCRSCTGGAVKCLCVAGARATHPPLQQQPIPCGAWRPGEGLVYAFTNVALGAWVNSMRKFVVLRKAAVAPVCTRRH